MNRPLLTLLSALTFAPTAALAEPQTPEVPAATPPAETPGAAADAATAPPAPSDAAPTDPAQPAPAPTASAPAPAAPPPDAPTAAPASPARRPVAGVRVYEPEYRHRLDIGGAFGINSGGGFGPFAGYGLTADFRLFDYGSVGATVGVGLWGARFTPHARLYPLSVARGLFLEAGYTWNSGGEVAFCREPEDVESFGGCDDEDQVKLDLEVVRTANATLGYRHDIAGRGWIAAQLGWAYRVDHPAYTVERGEPLEDDEQDVLKFARPGGFVLGISGGFSVL